MRSVNRRCIGWFALAVAGVGLAHAGAAVPGTQGLDAHRVYIPIANKAWSPAEEAALFAQLRRAKPYGVFLGADRCLSNEEALTNETALLQKNVALLRTLGVKVGVWACPTIGYGEKTPLDSEAVCGWTRLKSVWNGRELGGAFCPTDERFMAALCVWFRELARLKPDLILLEDDYNLTGHAMDVVGCCCDRHLRLVSERLHEPVTVELLREKLFTGGSNKYRSAWLAVMGDTLRQTTARIRAAVDEAAPDLRIGLAANRTSFDFEGVDLFTLARIAAGKNRPFIRLTGAPYWRNADRDMDPAAIVECVRLQASWASDPAIELVTEGDTYPRPRYYVSASELEGYDTALRASGCADGILKYMFDYTSKPGYETGYIDAHVRNGPRYAELSACFGGTAPVGLTVFEPMARYECSDLGSKPSLYGRGSFLMMSQRFLCDQSVPLSYRPSGGACAAFGESAKYLPEEACQRGVLTDAIGARHLMARGIDVGIISCAPGSRPVFEHFIDEDEDRPVGDVGTFYRFALKPQASVKSRFVVGSRGFGSSRAGTDAYPACYIYENAKRQRFMVYAFDLSDFVEDSIWATGVSKSYCRQRQVQSGIAELQGYPLPAVCPGHPGLHLICGEKNGALSVGLWNFGRDPVCDPEIVLGRRYGSIEYFGCGGRLEGNRVRLDAPLQPYSFCSFRVSP